ncbi:hypothetical protein AK812_SmicGene22531 [Symbiodinium microadriaticum]|uniref:Uncharacterized protein n=1 Tax=Symbiodinium microadriaticum TaxID=2951 RepID=A0A1Q9DJK0_SYMMI|nr:hypothetical protein AK812_SmicGene22531 [Symbiodinium microadriaticum]
MDNHKGLEQGALASCLLLAPQRCAKARRRQRVAQAAAVVAFEEQDFEQEEAEEAQEELELQPGVADVVIVITDPLGQEDTNRLPAVGDTVQFSSGAIAYVVALGDLCFAGVLTNAADEENTNKAYPGTVSF